MSTSTVAQSSAMQECVAAEEQVGCNVKSARASAGVMVTGEAFERCLGGWEALRKCFESGLQLARVGATSDVDDGDVVGDVVGYMVCHVIANRKRWRMPRAHSPTIPIILKT